MNGADRGEPAGTPPDPEDLPTSSRHGADTHHLPGGTQRFEGLDEWLTSVARTAAADAHAPIDLLGEYLRILADAALSGRRPEEPELAAVRELGAHAAQQGVDAHQAVDLYLSAAWRMWQQIPTLLTSPREREKIRAAAEAVLRVINDAVQALVEGHQAARRQMIRQEESTRREFIDDLLRGDADVSRLVERAQPFGLDLGRPHQVVLAAPTTSPANLERAATLIARFIVNHFGDREVLITTKDDLLVMLLPGQARDLISGLDIGDPAGLLHTRLSHQFTSDHWRVAAGRAFPGAYGIARSYEEAREALLLARRLDLDDTVVPSRDVLVYRVLGRDQAALVDLVDAVLAPLTRARGGAPPLLQTLHTYFATGAVTAETARRLHLSVRTVTYRLARVHTLTGYDPADPAQHLALHMAVAGARLLNWPTAALPELPRS